MFCPKCGQSQTSDEMRFCSRCGFQLGNVALILDHDGAFPVEKSCQVFRSQRSRVAAESIALTVITWLVALACTQWLGAGGVYEGIATIASVIFFILGFIGLIRFLNAFLFMKSETSVTVQTPRMQDPARSRLSPPTVNPITDWQRREVTREIAPQMSVTDNTTRLLNEQ